MHGHIKAGNVIGGGDWSKDRLIPDAIKSFYKNKRVFVTGATGFKGLGFVVGFYR